MQKKGAYSAKNSFCPLWCNYAANLMTLYCRVHGGSKASILLNSG